MKNRAKSIVRAAWVVALVAPATVAAAQETGAQGLNTGALLNGVVATLVYGLLGIGLTMIGYRLFAWMLPFDVKKELEEDHNMSVGVLLAALVLGVCVVVAATIHS